jgi:hypothetical protein
VQNKEKLESVLFKTSSGVVDLERLVIESAKLAKEKLDYAVLARRVL